MTVVLERQPWGGYAAVYERLPGEYADLARRAEERLLDMEEVRRLTTAPTTLVTMIRHGLRVADLTINQLADEVGVSCPTAATWLKGRKAPNNHNLLKVCTILNLDYRMARRLSGRDPVAIIGSSETARLWNGGTFTERGADG